MTDPRRALHAYLSDEAHDGWHDFAAEYGVSVSGLLEAMVSSGQLSDRKLGSDDALMALRVSAGCDRGE